MLPYIFSERYKMLHKVMWILKVMRSHTILSLEPMTIGELSRISKKPYSSVRRWLEIALNSELVEFDERPYKATGKRVFWITEKGFDWLEGYRELGI